MDKLNNNNKKIFLFFLLDWDSNLVNSEGKKERLYDKIEGLENGQSLQNDIKKIIIDVLGATSNSQQLKNLN